ncbi:MAG: NAD-dependent epimerase/dehydratase family protein [Rhodobacteraceae bacterium]|nr:NAD-dependent epimerase/dehydratase family protein [Paracoccaceae bacterium]
MPEKILISGAAGFIAMHTIKRLLAAGHIVVGTVRDPDDAAKTAPLRAMPGAGARLSLVAADLDAPDPFTTHADVDVIFHMATPFAVDVDDPQRDLVDPAVDGTLAMMRAAAGNPRVRRVVLTSSMAAIMDEPGDQVISEDTWNTSSSLTRNPYYYAKTLAERAAWDFMSAGARNFDLVVLNPFIVIGPSHTATLNPSNAILARIVNGGFPGILDLAWGFVDVRSVADAHVEAMRRPEAEGRHILAAQPIPMSEVCEIIADLGYGANMRRLNLSGGLATSLIKLVSHTQPKGSGSYLRTHLGRMPKLDNTKSQRALGIDYGDPRVMIRDAIADMARWGHIDPAKASSI